MDVENWQAARIGNSRYVQDNTPLRPWPSTIQVRVLGARGSGRHSLLNRICLGDAGAGCDSGCKQLRIRNLPCSIWFNTPPSLTDHDSNGYAMSKTELRTCITSGFWGCDALVLAYDLTDETSFQALGKFVRRCDMERLGVAMGTSLPCLVVGTKCDRPTRLVHVEDGERLAKKLGGKFLMISSRTGQGFENLVEDAVNAVVDARIRLIQESEETLGEAIRALMTKKSEKRHRLKKLSAAAAVAPRKPEPRRPVSRALCNGAPPRWTMRDVTGLPAWLSVMRANDSEEEEAPLLRPCPPQYQLSVDIVEPAATWRAEDVMDVAWNAAGTMT